MTTMTLLWSPRSPFARKAAIAATLCGLGDAIAFAQTLVALDRVPGPDLLKLNPLGKIPVLLRQEASPLYDSRVICACLDAVAGGGRLLPREGEARLDALRREALGDGLSEALLLWRREAGRGAAAESGILAGFDAKVRAILAHLDASSPRGPSRQGDEPADVGDIAIFTALDHLDFRFAGCGWRDAHRSLSAWHEAHARHPAFANHRAPAAPDGTAPLLSFGGAA
ncbi:MAG: glutathione S-transferase family protein [Azospirillaceae bacterium]